MVRLAFGPMTPVIDEIRAAAERHFGGIARIATAWARDEGAGWFVNAVNNRVNELHALVGVNERGTTVEGLLRLLDVATTLKVFFKHPRQTFHPKLYWFEGGSAADSTTAIIGSANLTRGGLFTNFEASLIAEIDHATAATDEEQLLDALRTTWEALQTSPYAHDVRREDDVRSLFEHGYLTSEARCRRESRQGGRSEAVRRRRRPSAREHARLGDRFPSRALSRARTAASSSSSTARTQTEISE